MKEFSPFYRPFLQEFTGKIRQNSMEAPHHFLNCGACQRRNSGSHSDTRPGSFPQNKRLHLQGEVIDVYSFGGISLQVGEGQSQSPKLCPDLSFFSVSNKRGLICRGYWWILTAGEELGGKKSFTSAGKSESLLKATSLRTRFLAPAQVWFLIRPEIVLLPHFMGLSC